MLILMDFPLKIFLNFLYFPFAKDLIILMTIQSSKSVFKRKINKYNLQIFLLNPNPEIKSSIFVLFFISNIFCALICAKFAGKWYRVGLAYDSPGFERMRDKVKISMGIVSVMPSGNVNLTMWEAL